MRLTALAAPLALAIAALPAAASAARVPPGAARAAAGPTLGGCPVFPASNAWNRDVSRLPVHPRSRAFIASISSHGDRFLHADFGGHGQYGIPYSTVPASQARLPVRFTEYGDESDPGPYPIPLRAPIEPGGDRHVLVVQRGACKLYELYHAQRGQGGWRAGNGAVFDLRSNRLRPAGWTSADAAGLPILPGLARYDEAQSGAIRHALRFTVAESQRGYIFPARHFASDDRDPNHPPMGLRVRMKAGYQVGRFHGQARVILAALKRYGMIVADNGSDWFISGAADRRWSDEDLNQLKTVPGSAFEAVSTGPVRR
jgi:hypothetical protein